MREISYATRQVKGCNGQPLVLAYSLLVTGAADEPEHYGVRIEEQVSGSLTQVLDLTTQAKRIYDLLDKLVRNAVTPIGLRDVLEDWL